MDVSHDPNRLSSANADVPSGTAAEETLRSLLNSFCAAMASPLADFVANAQSPARTLKAAPVADDKRLDALLFALKHFAELSDACAGGITAETIRQKIWYGGLNVQERLHLSYLHREMANLGHCVGTRKNTTYVSAGSFAMPITFTEQIYVIDTLDLFKQVVGSAGPQSL